MVKSKIKLFKSDIVYLTIVYSFLLITLLTMVYPFIITLSTSISNNKALIAAGTTFLLPKGFSLAAYELLITTPNILKFYLNTVIYSFFGTLLMLIVCVTTAYPLAHKCLPGRKIIMLLFTLTLFFSGGLLPYYMWLRTIGLNNNIWVMIIPAGINVWNMIIFKTFFEQLPQGLKDAARIDGANDIGILFTIILPLSKPIIATFSVFGIVGIWNDYFTPMIFLRDNNLFPLQLFLRSVIVNMDTRIMTTGPTISEMTDFIDGRTVRAAVVIITVLPIACVYPFFQKYFAKGILIGSLKG